TLVPRKLDSALTIPPGYVASALSGYRTAASPCAWSRAASDSPAAAARDSTVDVPRRMVRFLGNAASNGPHRCRTADRREPARHPAPRPPPRRRARDHRAWSLGGRCTRGATVDVLGGERRLLVRARVRRLQAAAGRASSTPR